MMRRNAYIFAFCSLIFSAGCNILQIPTIAHRGEMDTPFYGRTPSRDNSVAIAIAPPLRLAWEVTIPAGIGPGSLLYIDSVVFVGNQRGEVQVINVRSGKKFGSTSFGGSIEGSPVIDRELVIVALAGTRESLVAYDFVNARMAWRSELGDIHASPLLLGSRLFVGNTQGTAYALERATGATVWQFDLPENTALKGIRSSAAGIGEHVIFGADDGVLYDLDARTGSVRWKVKADASIQATPSIADSVVFVGSLNGTMYAVRISDGRILWSHSLGGGVYSLPVIRSGLCIVGTTAGKIFALQQHTGAEVWSCDLQAPVSAGLLATDSVLYGGTLSKELVALSLSRGTILWREPVSGRIKTTPIVAAGRLIVATDDRSVLAYTEGAR
jgi:eukaryotic-like serine/threonine-protein kinase